MTPPTPTIPPPSPPPDRVPPIIIPAIQELAVRGFKPIIPNRLPSSFQKNVFLREARKNDDPVISYSRNHPQTVRFSQGNRNIRNKPQIQNFNHQKHQNKQVQSLYRNTINSPSSVFKSEYKNMSNLEENPVTQSNKKTETKEVLRNDNKMQNGRGQHEHETIPKAKQKVQTLQTQLLGQQSQNNEVTSPPPLQFTQHLSHHKPLTINNSNNQFNSIRHPSNLYNRPSVITQPRPPNSRIPVRNKPFVLPPRPSFSRPQSTVRPYPNPTRFPFPNTKTLPSPQPTYSKLKPIPINNKPGSHKVSENSGAAKSPQLMINNIPISFPNDANAPPIHIHAPAGAALKISAPGSLQQENVLREPEVPKDTKHSAITGIRQNDTPPNIVKPYLTTTDYSLRQNQSFNTDNKPSFSSISQFQNSGGTNQQHKVEHKPNQETRQALNSYLSPPPLQMNEADSTIKDEYLDEIENDDVFINSESVKSNQFTRIKVINHNKDVISDENLGPIGEAHYGFGDPKESDKIVLSYNQIPNNEIKPLNLQISSVPNNVRDFKNGVPLLPPPLPSRPNHRSRPIKIRPPQNTNCRPHNSQHFRHSNYPNLRSPNARPSNGRFPMTRNPKPRQVFSLTKGVPTQIALRPPPLPPPIPPQPPISPPSPPSHPFQILFPANLQGQPTTLAHQNIRKPLHSHVNSPNTFNTIDHKPNGFISIQNKQKNNYLIENKQIIKAQLPQPSGKMQPPRGLPTDVQFPSSEEIEDDFHPMGGLSQPLPQGLVPQETRVSESHAKLMKNMEFGVNGEPLDVWIPITSPHGEDSDFENRKRKFIEEQRLGSELKEIYNQDVLYPLEKDTTKGNLLDEYQNYEKGHKLHNK
ncbi:unnamed protein product, partial [Meganyctiphanes norvegica]